jgi:hypothetical protein
MAVLEITIENKTVDGNLISVATASLDGSPIDIIGNFPPNWTAAQIQEHVEFMLFGQYFWTSTTVKDLR